MIFEEDFENYIPYELTSLNATNKDIQKLIIKINKKYGKYYLLKTKVNLIINNFNNMILNWS